MDLPLFRTTRVLHVGTLDPTERGQQCPQSLEGPCLSVSHHPEAWRTIAKLGSAPVWELTREAGCFVDVRATLVDSQHLAQVRAWGAAHGLCQLSPKWAAWWEDLDDPGTWLYTLHDTAEAAALELEDPTALQPDGAPCVHPLEVCEGTPRLAQWLGFPLLHRAVDDFLLLHWVSHNLPDVDGGWWHDVLAPLALSAPRGGILPDRISRWRARQL